MKRRDFIKTTGSAVAIASLTGLGISTLAKQDTKPKHIIKFPRYRGFNLTQKTGGTGPGRKFEEEDFEIMAEWGFDFARIPMSYWNWSSKEDWFTINEDVMTDIDEVVEL